MPTVKMIAPNGDSADVEPQDVEHYKSLGARLATGGGGGESLGTPDFSSQLLLPQARRGVTPTGSDAVRAGLAAIPSVAGMAGAMGGGALFGPGGAIGGSSVGGTAGKGIELLLRRQILGEPLPSGGQAAGQMALSGAEQGLAEGTGQIISGGLRLGAKTLMRDALRPGKAVQQEAMTTARRYMTPAQMAAEGRPTPASASLEGQALKERVAVGRGPLYPEGSRRMSDLAAKPARTLNRALASSGRKFTVQDAMGDISSLRAELAKQTDGARLTGRLNKAISEFMAANRLPGKKPGQIGPLKKFSADEFNDLKRTWQQTATPIYKAINSGRVVPTGGQAVKADFNATLARGARGFLEKQVPGVAAPNRRLAELAPLEEAVQNAEMRNPPQGIPFLTWLKTPQLTSRVALAATEPWVQQLGMQSPRTLDALLRMYMAAQQPDTTGGR